MSARGCGLGRSARELRRHQYCGTCKVMGREYGQSSRLFLNHDTVLVAEIVTALSKEPEWGQAIDSRNCFNLPERSESTPPALRYAAAATVLLAAAKVQDHAYDSGKLRWRMLARWIDPRYRRAAAELERWGVPVKEIERQLATQSRLEASPESLQQLAGPTCFATAMICRHAAPLAQREELAPAMHQFGHRFGYLIYLLDAWEDFEKDAARGDFNALSALYGGRGFARGELTGASAAVEQSLQDLPLPNAFRDELLMRFRSNFARRFSETLPVLGQPAGARGTLAIAGLGGIMMAAVDPAKRRFGACRDMAKGTWCEGCTDGCCDSCGDSCCDGCCDCDCG